MTASVTRWMAPNWEPKRRWNRATSREFIREITIQILCELFQRMGGLPVRAGRTARTISHRTAARAERNRRDPGFDQPVQGDGRRLVRLQHGM